MHTDLKNMLGNPYFIKSNLADLFTGRTEARLAGRCKRRTV